MDLQTGLLGPLVRKRAGVEPLKEYDLAPSRLQHMVARTVLGILQNPKIATPKLVLVN